MKNLLREGHFDDNKVIVRSTQCYDDYELGFIAATVGLIICELDSGDAATPLCLIGYGAGVMLLDQAFEDCLENEY